MQFLRPYAEQIIDTDGRGDLRSGDLKNMYDNPYPK